MVTNFFCQNVGQTFHLINSKGSPKWSDFIKWLQQKNFNIQFVPLQQWLKM